MAYLLNRVFTVYVRPTYTTSIGNKVFHKGELYVKDSILGTTMYLPLATVNVKGSVNSPAVLNSEGKFTKDPWMLYGTWTSYAKMQNDLKDIIAVYGTENVRVGVHIPIDYLVLPVE